MRTEDPRRALARSHFARQVARDEADLDLAEAALWIAAEDAPGVAVEESLRELDRLAEQARPALEAAGDEAARVAALGEALFRRAGFHGNRERYYDPRNSHLDQVLARRTGIPITLCLVYVEVAQRLGLHAAGIAFPGHFLAKVVGSRVFVVDAFEGRLVDEAECAERWKRAVGPDQPFDPTALRAARSKEILFRMLSNLKQIRVAEEDWEAALACCDRLRLLAPDAPFELRDRGLVYRRLECFVAAREDLERFVRLVPRHPSARALEGLLADLRERVRQLH